jgi:hypothetical protein
MLVNAPDHTLAARSFLAGEAGEHSSSAFEWVLKRIQGFVCGLHGHDSVLQYERDRMFLRCTSCGHETNGWEVVPSSRLVRHRPEIRAARPAPELEMVRRIA